MIIWQVITTYWDVFRMKRGTRKMRRRTAEMLAQVPPEEREFIARTMEEDE